MTFDTSLEEFHDRRDAENLAAFGPLSYEEWVTERERLIAVLSRMGVRGFERGVGRIYRDERPNWRRRWLLLGARLRYGWSFKGDWSIFDDWFGNRLLGIELLSPRMFRNDLISVLRRHLATPDKGFTVMIVGDFPLLYEIAVTACECRTNFDDNARRKAETMARNDPEARQQLHGILRLLDRPPRSALPKAPATHAESAEGSKEPAP